MRLLFPPVFFVITAIALTGCGDFMSAAKPGKAAETSGRQEVVLRLAHATESAGDLPGAEKMFQQAITRNPDATEPKIELAEFYKRHNQDDKAAETLAGALKAHPDDAATQRALANAYINMAEPEKALTVLDAAIAKNDRDPLLYNSKGVALDQTGRYAEAQQSYRKAFEIDPSESMMYKINTSMSYILEGTYDKAIALLRPLLDVPDAPVMARQNLALAYGLKGDNDSALKLGLHDLSTAEAEENIRFYRMLAQKHKSRSMAKAIGTPTVPASVVRELFPEESPKTGKATEKMTVAAPKPAPKPPVADKDMTPGGDAETPKPVLITLPPKKLETSPLTLPDPVLKQQDSR